MGKEDKYFFKPMYIPMHSMQGHMWEKPHCEILQEQSPTAFSFILNVEISRKLYTIISFDYHYVVGNVIQIFRYYHSGDLLESHDWNRNLSQRNPEFLIGILVRTDSEYLILLLVYSVLCGVAVFPLCLGVYKLIASGIVIASRYNALIVRSF